MPLEATFSVLLFFAVNGRKSLHLTTPLKARVGSHPIVNPMPGNDHSIFLPVMRTYMIGQNQEYSSLSLPEGTKESIVAR